MEELKEIIEDIREKLKNGLFATEEHVRLSLVARICQSLGWDIWNPAEYNTEFKVLTDADHSTGYGFVDVALFIPDKRHNPVRVYIEAKRLGELMPKLDEYEGQLHKYTWVRSVPIGILTDGKIWHFYAPKIDGKFKERLFAKLDIVNDDIDDLVDFFNDVLRRDSVRDDNVLEIAKRKFELNDKIKRIQSVKYQAINKAKGTKLSPITIAKSMLEDQGDDDITEKEIEEYWDRTIPNSGDEASIQTKDPTTTESSTASADVTLTPPTSKPVNCVEVFIKTKAVNAKGCYDPVTNKLKLYSGSDVSKVHNKDSLSKSNIKLKKQMEDRGELQLKSPTKYELIRDHVFNSPSSASSFVFGRASNGFDDWLDVNNDKLDKYNPKKLNIPANSATSKLSPKATPIPAVTDSLAYDSCVNVFINNADMDIDAWGKYDVATKQFTLCRGSELNKNPQSPLTPQNADIRDKMMSEGFLLEHPKEPKYVLTDDYTFDHISHATAIVLCRTSGGYMKWLDEDGNNLSSDYKPSEAIRSKVNPKGKSIIRKHPNLKDGDLKVYIDSTELTATGHYSPKSKKITVYRGSEVQKEHDPALRKIHIEKKKDLIDKQILLPHPTKKAVYIFMEDYPLALTPAAVIVLGKKIPRRCNVA